MVIGPNGTGKSTLVCAICLGLGWKTEHLGRAKNLGEFVKHGSREAEIEIELAADPDRHDSNPVIKHHIRKEGDKSSFSINGKQVPRKQVLELCRSFAIQVDNLCQFLPQDRVVEFAALSPEDLLVQTQRAAAPEYLVEWHDELKTLRSTQKRTSHDQQMLSENLRNLEGRQNLQRTDVELLRERNDIQERVVALQKLRPVALYRASRDRWKDLKARRTAANRELEALREESEPALRAATVKKEYCAAVQEVVKGRQRLYERGEKRASDTAKKQDEINGSIEEANTEMDAEKNSNKKHKTERARIEAAIRNLQVQQEQQPPDFDAAEYNERLREMTRQIRDLKEKAHDANMQQRDTVDQIRTRRQRVDQAKRDIEELHSQAGQQNNKLKQVSVDTLRAWQWIQNNSNRFKDQVYGPPIVSCSVRNQRHAPLVENMLGNGEMLAITVVDEADFHTLNSVLFDELGLKDVNIRQSPTDMSLFQSPVPREELAALGLDAYVVDLLEGPQPVLNMLCDNRNAHATAVAFRDLTSDQYEAIIRTSINAFVTPKESYTITRRREYGDQGTSTRTRRVKEARFFTDQAIDTGVEQELRGTIRELEHDIQELAKQAETHQATSKEFGVECRKIEEQHQSAQEEKNAKQKALSEFNALPVKIANQEEKLAKIDEREAEYRDRIHAIQSRIDKAILDRGQEALNYATAVNALQKLYTDLIESVLLFIEAESDLETLDARNHEINDSLAEREAEVQNLITEVARARQEADTHLRAVNEMTETRTQREFEIQNEQSDQQTSDELEIEIESLRARLDMGHDGNPHILREYEERGQKIEKGREKLARVDGELVRLEQQIGELRGRWEPELDALIAKISDAFGENFARIGCAGQVGVHKDEEFESWSIQVLVKFR